jgi:hypothetical protein
MDMEIAKQVNYQSFLIIVAVLLGLLGCFLFLDAAEEPNNNVEHSGEADETGDDDHEYLKV